MKRFKVGDKVCIDMDSSLNIEFHHLIFHEDIERIYTITRTESYRDTVQYVSINKMFLPHRVLWENGIAADRFKLVKKDHRNNGFAKFAREKL